METFHNSHTGKGPARTAVALFLNGSDSIVFSPIDSFEQRILFRDTEVGSAFRLDRDSSSLEECELVEAKVHVLVDSKGIGMVFFIVLGDQIIILLENFKTGIMLMGSISLVISFLPSSEFLKHRVF